MATRRPLLFVTAIFPPCVNGSSILIRNLWSEWPAEDLVVLSYTNPDCRIDPAVAMPGVPVHLVERWPFPSGRLATHLDPLAAGAVMRAIHRLAAEVKPRAIWANWPTTAFLLGAWYAARRLRLPLYVHLHDMWREGFNGRRLYVERLAAWYHERSLLRSVARLFSITEEARDHYLKKLGVDSFVLPHTVPEADLAATASPFTAAAEPGVLHFAGTIYPLMNEDALVSVVRALEHCRGSAVLDCYTPDSADILAARGIGGPRVRVRFAPKAEVMAAQRAAELLVLPLAFRSTNPLEIRTVFPTKLLEYLVSGRPILVHAPPDSWASRSARRDGWGEVVDSPDPATVAAAIDALIADPERQRSLVAAAHAEARRRAAPLVADRLRQEFARLEAGG
jgi:glycosyltransferase involved in cell wall biosynthesis